MTPFLTLLTPTYRRPAGLAACLESVRQQTAAADVEQVVLPDHVGLGVVDGLFGRLPHYAAAVHGAYVNILADDDVLADPTVVERIRAFAFEREAPAVIVATVVKNGMQLPACLPEGPPQCGLVDLTSFIVRADVWRAHVRDYGRRYEGDFDHADALWKAGHRYAFCPLVWARGGAGHGRPEEGA